MGRPLQHGRALGGHRGNTDHQRPRRPPTLEAATEAAWGTAAITWWCDIRHHRRRLCERCISSIPLDLEALVARRRAVLRAYHAHAATAIAALIAAATQVPLLLLSPRGHSPLWSYAVASPGVVIIGACTLITWQHRRLRPWCPWCRRGYGGHHEASPDIPAPTAHR